LLYVCVKNILLTLNKINIIMKDINRKLCPCDDSMKGEKEVVIIIKN
jgi:hypothetical protein